MTADADVIFDIHKDWQIPKEQLAAFKQQRTACAIGEKIAKDYHIKVGDRVVIVGDIYPVTVVGPIRLGELMDPLPPVDIVRHARSSVLGPRTSGRHGV